MGRRLLNRKIGYAQVNRDHVAMSRTYFHHLVQMGVFGTPERLGRKVVVQEAFVREWARGGQKSTRSIIANKIAQESRPESENGSGTMGDNVLARPRGLATAKANYAAESRLVGGSNA